MIEETFFLYPPEWLKNPPNPASTQLFKRYAKNAPPGTWPQNTSTHQGLYCMAADGGFLSGKFANPSNALAKEILTSALQEWRQEAAAGSKPVPTHKLDLFGGDPLQKGGIKLEVIYRDFPRGDIERPGTPRFPNPHNLGWYDFSPEVARAFLAEPGAKKAIPQPVFRKFAIATLKDAVRGQMNGWKENELKSGELFSELVREEGPVEIYRLTGSAEFSAGERSYSPTLHGIVKFNTARGEFTEFQLVAAGQRTGKGPANGRESDPGPAPMGVGFELYK